MPVTVPSQGIAPVPFRSPVTDEKAFLVTRDWVQWFQSIAALLAFLRNGQGDPEAVMPGPVGTLYIRLDGTPGNTLYLKQTDPNPDHTVGWVAIA